MEKENASKDFISSHILRRILLVLIAINIIMAIIATFMYPPLLTMPHVYSYIVELGIILLVYIIIVIWVTRFSKDINVLRVATAFVIADIFEACFKVSFLGPILGIIFGLVGAAIARLFIRKKVQV